MTFNIKTPILRAGLIAGALALSLTAPNMADARGGGGHGSVGVGNLAGGGGFGGHGGHFGGGRPSGYANDYGRGEHGFRGYDRGFYGFDAGGGYCEPYAPYPYRSYPYSYCGY